MKSVAAFTSLLVAAVTASPLQSRQGYGQFDIKDLQIGCIPHSSQCYYNFNATVSPTLTTPCTAIGLSYQTIPNLPPTACQDPNVSFSYTIVTEGSYLNVAWGYDVGRNLTGEHFIPSSEIIWTNEQVPTGRIQVYNGPQAFAITDLKATAVL